MDFWLLTSWPKAVTSPESPSSHNGSAKSRTDEGFGTSLWCLDSLHKGQFLSPLLQSEGAYKHQHAQGVSKHNGPTSKPLTSPFLLTLKPSGAWERKELWQSHFFCLNSTSGKCKHMSWIGKAPVYATFPQSSREASSLEASFVEQEAVPISVRLWTQPSGHLFPFLVLGQLSVPQHALHTNSSHQTVTSLLSTYLILGLASTVIAEDGREMALHLPCCLTHSPGLLQSQSAWG